MKYDDKNKVNIFDKINMIVTVLNAIVGFIVVMLFMF